MAFGLNTLALGGRVFDEVILHTYFTPETLQRWVKTVKSAAEKAGPDPDSVRARSAQGATAMTALAPTVEAFFTQRLAVQRDASPHTVAATKSPREP